MTEFTILAPSFLSKRITSHALYAVSASHEVTIEQSKVDAARVELNKLNYKYERQVAYPDWGDQLDYIYHNGIDKWKTDVIDPVKTKYPKPE